MHDDADGPVHRADDREREVIGKDALRRHELLRTTTSERHNPIGVGDGSDAVSSGQKGVVGDDRACAERKWRRGPLAVDVEGEQADVGVRVTVRDAVVDGQNWPGAGQSQCQRYHESGYDLHGMLLPGGAFRDANADADLWSRTSLGT